MVIELKRKTLSKLKFLGFCINFSAASQNSFYNFLYDIIHKDAAGNHDINKPVEEMTLEELGMSRGVSHYNFLDYITLYDRHCCHIDDEYILHLLPPDSTANGGDKPPIMVKCLKQHPLLQNNTNYLRVMNSVQEIVELLKPIGNSTKRYEPGSCVLVYFYTTSCVACRMMALSINALPYAFKSLPVAAIDAYKFSSFNTEYGIVGLPTLLLFHQGRPVVRKRTKVNFKTFIIRHTGLTPSELPENFNITLPLDGEPQTDYILVLAWLFIIICGAYYFTKLTIYTEIIEMIKRNWRESEAQLEPL